MCVFFYFVDSYTGRALGRTHATITAQPHMVHEPLSTPIHRCQVHPLWWLSMLAMASLRRTMILRNRCTFLGMANYEAKSAQLKIARLENFDSYARALCTRRPTVLHKSWCLCLPSLSAPLIDSWNTEKTKFVDPKRSPLSMT